MYYTYILLMSDKRLYIGYSTDLQRRLTEHSQGKDTTTKKFLPIKLLFYEAFLSKKDAQRREKYFKTSRGKSTLKMMLRETIEILKQ